MAIKGNLNDFSFPELLKLIGNYEGVLKIADEDRGRNLECFIRNKQISCAKIDNRDAANKELFKYQSVEISTRPSSVWNFTKQPVRTELEPLISLTEWVNFAASKSINKDIPENYLPHIDTKYITSDNGEIVLESKIGEFWDSCSSMLKESCSGSDICWQLGLDTKIVQTNLHFLRGVGMIKPLRIFEITDPQERLRLVKRNFELANLRKNKFKAESNIEMETRQNQPSEVITQSYSPSNSAAVPTFQNNSYQEQNAQSIPQRAITPTQENTEIENNRVVSKTEIPEEKVGLVRRMLRSIFG